MVSGEGFLPDAQALQVQLFTKPVDSFSEHSGAAQVPFDLISTVDDFEVHLEFSSIDDKLDLSLF
jgi:hypothetical protein